MGWKPRRETLEHDGIHNYEKTVPDALELSGWHKMQYPQQQHSHKELGLTVLPLEDKMKNPIYFGFIHQSVEEIQAEYQVVGFFSGLVLILFPLI